MIFNTEKKIITAVSFSGLLALAIALAVIWPTANYIKKINDETYNLRSYLEKKYENVIHLRSAVKNITAVKETVASFTGHIFHAGEELKLITELENIAARNHVTQKIDSSNIDKITDNRISIGLSASGNYRDLLRYLADLEQSPYFLNIEDLIFSPAGERAGDPASAGLRLNINLYVSS